MARTWDGNAHYQPTLLIVGLCFLNHLLYLSASTCASRLRADLVIIDYLSYILEKFRNFFSARLKNLGQRPQPLFDAPKLAGKTRSSVRNATGETTTYSITSLRHLCSSTSLGRESKHCSSAVTRAMRASILFPMGVISCK